MSNSPGMIHVPIPKALLILTQAEYIKALKRGKAYKRREAIQKRIKGRTNQRGN